MAVRCGCLLVPLLLASDASGVRIAPRRAVVRDAAAVAAGVALLGRQWPASADEGEGELAAAPAAASVAEAVSEPDAAPPPAPAPPPTPSFDVPFRGESTPIKPFLGRASIVVNVKFDDPATLDQLPGLQALYARYNAEGLHVLAFPTDQGWFEADDSNTLRLKFKSVYDVRHPSTLHTPRSRKHRRPTPLVAHPTPQFGQYPAAVVFDKARALRCRPPPRHSPLPAAPPLSGCTSQADLLGGNALPFYSWLTRSMSNPWGVQRLVFDYEKFLLAPDGTPLRRYPRKCARGLRSAALSAPRRGGRPPPSPAGIRRRIWRPISRLCSRAGRCRRRARRSQRRGRTPSAKRSRASTHSSQVTTTSRAEAEPGS